MPATAPDVALLLACAATLLAAAGAAAALVRVGPVDPPRDRSPHRVPTPTSGGLALIAAVGLGIVLLPRGALAPPPEAFRLAAAFGLAALLGLIGGLDDLFDLDPRLKLGLQVALALAFAAVARVEAIPLSGAAALNLGPVLGSLGTVLWIVVVINAVNFMDGANGLAAGSLGLMLVVEGVVLRLAGDGPAGALALLAGSANLGFLPLNFPRAHIFQGDAGALFSSFLLAALAVVGAGSDGRGPLPVAFAPLLLLPFLTDVLFTLLRRARARRPLLRAHAEHLYQRWMARRGGDHVGLALRMYGLVAASGLLAVAAAVGARTAPAAALLLLVLAVLAAAAAWRRLSERADRS